MRHLTIFENWILPFRRSSLKDSEREVMIRSCGLQLLFFSLILSLGPARAQGLNESFLDSTNYYVLHNNYWINLHHFLYQKAKGSQEAKLKSDGNKLQEIGESELLKGLTKSEKRKLKSAVDYYKTNLIKKSLIRDLATMRLWFQNQPDVTISDTSFSAAFTAVLNDFSPVYEEKLWPLHKTHNEEIFRKQLGTIKQLENSVIPKVEKFAMCDWPDKVKVRVDLTAYANYAGAYTPTRPRMNIFLSTLDPDATELAFIETVFHEGTHLLFRFGGPWRGGISDLFDNTASQMDYPRHLWHVSLFYLCGRIMEDLFAENGTTEYKMVLFTRDIFKPYHSDALFEALEKYYKEELAFDETVIQMLNVLEKEHADQ